MKFGTKRRAWNKVVSVLWRCLCPEMDIDDGDSVLILKSFLRWKKYLVNCGSLLVLFNPFTAKCGQRQVSTKFPNFIFQNCEKQIASCESTGRELSFEWSHHRISSTDSKVRVTLQNSIKHSGSERVKRSLLNKTNYSYNHPHLCNMELYTEENVNWCPNQCDYRSIRRGRL